MTWKGEEFSLLGTTDGIMVDRRTGEKIGLEIKSKQETPSKTSLSAMKEADPKHVKQCVSYGEMYVRSIHYRLHKYRKEKVVCTG